MEPIKLEFIVKGDIDKELSRINLAIKGVGDQSYSTFSRLLQDSNKSFTGLTAGTQSFATTLQNVIGCLHANEQAQRALYAEYEKGAISSAEYADAQARLSIQQTTLKNQASELVRQIENEIRQNNMASGSLNQKLSLLSSLQQQYAGLTEAERNNTAVGGALATQIKGLNNEITAIQANLKQEQQVEALVMGSLKQKQNLLGELQLQYASLSEAERNNAATGGALATQIKGLSNEITAIQANLKQEQQIEALVDGSLQERIVTLSRLREEYAKLGKAERESMIGTNLVTQIQQVDEEIMRMQANMGRVKIGATGFNSLGMSVQQVARELPSLTMGANMFFLAISNNLPILADNLKAARAEFNALKATNQAATPVWKQVLSSIMSWQTALVVGITLLSVYGKDIWEWTKSLLGAKKALDANLESLDSFQKKVSESSGNTVAAFKKMQKEWDALGNSLEAKKKYVTDNASAFRQIETSVQSVLEAERLFKNNGAAFIESLQLRAKAAAAMELASEKYKEAIQKMQEAETEQGKGVSFGDRMKSSFATSSLASSGQLGKSIRMDEVSPEAYRDERLKKLKTEQEQYFSVANTFLEKSIGFEKEQQKVLADADIATVDVVVANSVAAIEASIAQKKEALKKLTNKKDYAAAMIGIKKEEAALKGITGETDAEQKKVAETRSKLNDAILESELKLQASRIAVMEDGKSKRQLLAEQEYKETIDIIRKEKEEYEKNLKETGDKKDPAVMATFGNRESVAGDKRTADLGKIDKDYAEEYKERTKALTDVFLNEEERKLTAVKDRYDKERTWADEQLKSGSMTNDQHKSYTVNIDQAQMKENYNTLLSSLNDFKQQEKNLREKWDTDIAAAVEMKDAYLVARLMEGKQKALSALNSQMLQESSEWMRLFGNLDTLTVDELNKMIDSIQAQLDSGTLTLNPVDAKALMDSLSQAKDKVAEKSPFQALAKSSGEMKKSLADLKKAEDDGLTGEALDEYRNKVRSAAENVKKSISAIADAYGQVRDVMKSASEFISMVDEGLGETVNNALSLGDAVMNIGQVVATAVIGFANGMSTMETASVILLIIKAVLVAVMAAIALFNGDKKHEKKIKDLQGQVENLERAYKALGRTIENTYSNEVYSLMDKQEENMRKQQELIRQQIKEEEAKKKTDKEKVQEMKDNLTELDNAIEDSNRKQIEMWAGTDVQTAIDDYADALVDAYAQGEDGAKAMGETTKKVLANAVKEALKKQLLGKAMQDAVTQLGNDMSDGVLSPGDKKRFEDAANAAGERFTEAMKMYDDLFKDTGNQVKDGVSGQLQAAMTEGTASQLVGLWNSTAIDMRELKNLSIEQRDSVKSVMADVKEIVKQNYLIEQHTRRGADNTDGLIEELHDGFQSLEKRLADIEKNTKSNKSRG